MARTSTVSPSEATTSVLPNLDSIIRGLLYLYIFSLPFKRLLFIERNGFIILIVLLALWCATNRRHFFIKTPIDLPLVAFVAWVGFTVPFAIFPAYSSKEFAKLLQHGLIFYTVVYFFRNQVHRRRLVWMLLGTFSLVSLYGIWQYFTEVMYRNHLTWADLGRLHVIESFLPGEIWLTTYLVMLIPFALGLALYCGGYPAGMVSWACIFLGALCQLLTFSRAGLVSLLSEVVVGALITRRRVAVVVAALFIVSAGIGAGTLFHARSVSEKPIGGISDRKFDSSNLVARLNIWKYGLSKIPERPLMGFGYGKDNFHHVFRQETDRLQIPERFELPAGTHNVFVDLAVGIGPIGLALFIWLLGALAREAYRNFHHSTNSFQRALDLGLFLLIVGTAIRNSFDHMFVGSLAVLFWVLAALALSAKGHQQ